MGVNGGSGNPISFQDIQDFYGGSHPIAFSEYYRGGGEVPSTQTVTDLAAHSASGSGDANSGSINIDVQSTTQTPATAVNATLNGQSSITIPAGTVDFQFRINPKADGNLVAVFSSGSFNTSGLTFNQNGPAGSMGPGRAGWFIYGNHGYPSPYVVKVTGTPSSSRTWSSFAPRITENQGSVDSFTNNSQSVAARNFVFTNNTGQNISLTTTASSGGSSTSSVNNGSAITRGAFTGTSESWSVSYPQIQSTENTNTNVPTSGTVSMNTFNAPGNPAG